MKVTLPVYLHAQDVGYPDPDTGLDYRFALFGSDMSACGYIPLSAHKFEFDVPTVEQIIARHTVLLREEVKEVRATAEKKVAAIHEQLSKLESLTYTPSAAKEPNDVP